MGSSMVTMCLRKLWLMWSIMAARVVVLPEPVVPVTSTNAPRLESQLLHDRREDCSSAKSGTLGHHLAQGDGDGPPLPVYVDAEPAHIDGAVGEVDLVGLAEATDLLVAHERGGVVLGVVGRAGRLFQVHQFAIHPDHGGTAHLEVQVGGSRLGHLP